MKKPAAPSPPPGTTPPTTDGKAAAKEAAPPLSPEEAFAYGAFPQPPSFKDMLGSGGMYAEAGTFDQYVKRGKRLLTVFGSLPTLREGQPSVGAWRLQRREVWEDNKYWHKWGTLGDLHRFPLMDLPYDTHLREADDYLTAFSIKADIFRLNQYSPIKAVGARHWTRLNAPDHWKADALLDRIISGPLRFVQAKWWTAFPSFSLLGSRRSITMRLAFQAPNGEVLEEVPFNAVLQGWGPQAELSYRIQRGVLLPHPKAEDAPELQKIPRAINHEGGFDFTFLWLHFGWLRLRAFPSRYMFYWGVNLPLPSLGVQSIEPGQLVRDAEEMAFGWDRHVALRTYEDMLMHEAFPITAFTVGTSGAAPIRKFLADEEELLLKSWLQRYRDKQKAEADKAARLTEQAKGDSAILAEQVKREAERKDQEARVREEEARFAAAIQKVLPDLTADPEIAKKVDAKEKEAAAALLNPRAWAPFDRTDAKLLQTLAVERKFKEYYLNRLAERFDLWLDTEDNWALDEDVQEFLSFNRASWRGGSGPLDIERLEDDEGDDQEDIRRGVASNTLGFEFPPETMGSRGWMEWYKEENELQDFYTQWWINVLWDCREAWQKRREQYAVARRTPAWLSAKGVEQQKADYKEQEEADKQAFTESFDADELRDDVEDLEEEDELEAYEERLQKLEREDAGEPEREGEANEEEGSDPRSKVLRTRRRPKPPPKREEGGEF